MISHGEPSKATVNQVWCRASVITALGGAEVKGAGVPDRPGLHRETLSQNPSARAEVSGRVLTELAQVEFLH